MADIIERLKAKIDPCDGREDSISAVARDAIAEIERRAFLVELIAYLAKEDLADSVFYFEDKGQVKVCVNCNDMFWWATADGEEIKPDNFAVLKQSIEDCRTVDEYEWVHGLDLFACRVRKMRPQDAAYSDKKELWPLFDAAGPEREVDPKAPFGNPFRREAYWQKRQERKKSRIEELEAEIKRLNNIIACAETILIGVDDEEANAKADAAWQKLGEEDRGRLCELSVAINAKERAALDEHTEECAKVVDGLDNTLAARIRALKGRAS